MDVEHVLSVFVNTCCVFIIFEERREMNTKLTLTIEKEVIERAKAFAKSQNRSLSEMVENYLNFITRPERKENDRKVSIARNLRGSFKDNLSQDYKKELQDELAKKYLK